MPSFPATRGTRHFRIGTPFISAIALLTWMGPGKTILAQQPPAPDLGQESPAADSATGQKQDLWLFGAPEILWICQARFVDLGAPGPLLRFAYRETTARGAGLYRALPIDSIVGRLHMGAVRGRDLHIFFRDGSHRRYAASPTSPSRIALPMFTGELGLPDRALPLALTVDKASNGLFALVTNRDAAKIESNVAERAARLREYDEEDNVRSDSDVPGLAEEPPGLVAEAASDFAIVSYDGFAWSRIRNCPAEMIRDDSVEALLVHGSRIHIVYSKSEDAGALIHQFASEPAERWSQPSPLTVPAGSSVLTAGWAEDAAVLVLGEPANQGVVLRVLSWNQGPWEDRGALRNPEGQPVSFDATIEAGLHGNALALARSGQDGTPEIGTWSIATGEPMTGFEPVAPLAPVTGPQLRPATRTFISYVILMALLAGVVIWRRERIVIPAPVQPGQVFAALSARATAAIIDLFITAPVWASLAYWVWSGKGGLEAIAELANPSAAPSGAAVWTPAIMGAVYGLYAAAFELKMRTTPGKRLMRCTVVAEGGERCSARAVLIRNAARIVEFHFAAVVLLVVLTPSRQRLGDILARTVVTQPAPPEPEPVEQLEADRPEDSL